MIKTIKSHVNNDVKQIRAAWANMDNLSHYLVILGIFLLFLSVDMLLNRIHF